MSIFEPQQVFDALSAFLQSVPAMLKQSAETYDLASEVTGLSDVDVKPFSIAIVGQMRVGKSTLINAIVGDDVAITGVTETTATVNWIRKGSAEDSKHFRVVWDTEPPHSESFPRSQVSRWIGDSGQAQRTRYLEFFSPASFLDKIWIIDTPGSRSVYENHETGLRGLLSEEKSDRDTYYYGGTADCLVYVLPPVARENDAEILGQFGATTRFANASAYNCIAVLHKWEAILEHEQPWREAERMAAVQKEQLKRFVTDVVPVSGPLFRAACTLTDAYWERLLNFVRHTMPADLKRLMGGLEARFKSLVLPSNVLSPQERSELLLESRLPWACFKVVVKLAQQKNFDSGKALRDEVRRVGGIDHLQHVLQSRFFDRARVIRSAATLKKAISICEQAMRRLRISEQVLGDFLNEGDIAIQELTSAGSSVVRATEFVDAALKKAKWDHQQTRSLLISLEEASRTIRELFARYDDDLQSIRLLDDNGRLFNTAEVHELLSILGAYGSTAAERFGSQVNSDNTSHFQERLNYWCAKCEQSAGTRQRVLAQAVARLEEATHASYHSKS